MAHPLAAAAFVGIVSSSNVFCGLPVSFGQSSLACIPECNSREVVLLVELLAARFSEEESARLIVFKEFDAGASQPMDVLPRHLLKVLGIGGIGRALAARVGLPVRP